jgi:hypothetical protein
MTTHSARITGPVCYVAVDGNEGNIPLGPCLVEHRGHELIDIIWGVRGQRSAALPVAAVKAAQDDGNLVLLD